MSGRLFARPVLKAHALSWKVIGLHVPGRGEVGRISLEDVLDDELQPYVHHPVLLLIPDDEITDMRTRPQCWLSRTSWKSKDA